MGVNDIYTDILYFFILLYIVELLISVTTTFSLGRHLLGGYKRGLLNAYMVSLFFFLLTYTAQTVVILLYLTFHMDIVYSVATYNRIFLFLLLLTRTGSLISIFFIGYLIINKRFDLFITSISKDKLKED